MWNYHRLLVVTEAKSLIQEVYELTSQFPRVEQFGLTAQLRRAAVSIGSNIVEGSCRSSVVEFAHFLGIAIGSAAECEFQIGVACDLGLVPGDIAARAADHAQKVRRMTVRLRRSLLADR